MRSAPRTSCPSEGRDSVQLTPSYCAKTNRFCLIQSITSLQEHCQHRCQLPWRPRARPPACAKARLDACVTSPQTQANVRPCASTGPRHNCQSMPDPMASIHPRRTARQRITTRWGPNQQAAVSVERLDGSPGCHRECNRRTPTAEKGLLAFAMYGSERERSLFRVMPAVDYNDRRLPTTSRACTQASGPIPTSRRPNRQSSPHPEAVSDRSRLS